MDKGGAKAERGYPSPRVFQHGYLCSISVISQM